MVAQKVLTMTASKDVITIARETMMGTPRTHFQGLAGETFNREEIPTAAPIRIPPPTIPKNEAGQKLAKPGLSFGPGMNAWRITLSIPSSQTQSRFHQFVDEAKLAHRLRGLSSVGTGTG